MSNQAEPEVIEWPQGDEVAVDEAPLEEGCADWDDKLTAEQRAAAGYAGSHARLLAGPGSGKTHTLGRRVVYLVTQEGVDPSEILILTFTRMAARDLRRKIKDELKCYTNEMPHISTLHSFALRQLRRNARLIDSLPVPLRIADDWEESTLIQEDMKRLLKRDVRDVRKSFQKLSADWETLKADDPEWRENLPDAPFVGAWEDHRRRYGYTLRAELVYQLKRALAQTPGFQLEPRFSHVLIDEYQDLNPCDLAIAEAVVGRGASLMACGDDDQSIYGFRYAEPGGIRGFVGKFTGSADLVLTECRRCGADILNAALWVARQDYKRVEKSLHPAAGNPNGSVSLLPFPNGGSEAQGIAALCRKMIDAKIDAGDILVLVRSDRDGVFSAPLQTAFEHLGVPFVAKTDKSTVLDENHGRSFLAMLQIIVNPRDHLAWRARMKTVGRLGDSTVDAVYEFARQEGIGFGEAITRYPEFLGTVPGSTRKILEEVVRRTTQTAERFYDPSGAAKTTEELLDLVRAVAESEIVEENGRLKVLEFVEEIIADTKAKTIEDLLIGVALGSESPEAKLEKGRVNVLTMHQAKGLEAKVVFVMAAEDETMPREERAAAVEDDRRLLYVSMTRAKERLIITYSGSRSGRQMRSGRNPGESRRTLTRFLSLRGAAIPVTPGPQFADTWTP